MYSERCFPNPYDDYSEEKHGILESVVISRGTIKDMITKYVETIENRQSTSNQREDLYVGIAGIAFMFWKLSRSEEMKTMYPCLEHATKYITQAKRLSMEKEYSTKSTVAFLYGNAGIAAMSAVIAYDSGRLQDMENDIKDFLKGFPFCARTGRHDSDELLVGRAGYLHGIYWLNQAIPSKPIGNDVIDKICLTLIKRGRICAAPLQIVAPLMYEYHGKAYLGAAHGLCSILHALLESSWFGRTENGELRMSSGKLSDIKNTIDYLLTFQNIDGNFPTRNNSNRMLVHWCHGCAGVIYLFAKAYLIFHDETYLTCCRKCADAIWHYGLLRKGPGICHGVAGNGYAFLLMYRITGEKRYLYRAGKFAEFMNTELFVDNLLAPDRPYSLYEGLAGAVCFLVDLLNPQYASFPFMDVVETKYNV